MRSKRPRITSLEALGRFIKWAPIVALPFAAALFETWMHLGILRHDYLLNALTQQVAECDRRIDALRSEVATREAIDVIDAQGPGLGLIEPAPNQIVTVPVTTDGTLLVQSRDFAVAHSSVQIQPNAAME